MLSEPLILSDYYIYALDALFLALFIAKYIEKNLKRIFKIVLKVQIFTLALIIFSKNL